MSKSMIENHESTFETTFADRDVVATVKWSVDKTEEFPQTKIDKIFIEGVDVSELLSDEYFLGGVIENLEANS
jgi:hypothetical protein